jgi:hypothetical protein
MTTHPFSELREALGGRRKKAKVAGDGKTRIAERASRPARLSFSGGERGF